MIDKDKSFIQSPILQKDSLQNRAIIERTHFFLGQISYQPDAQ